jgi:probable phosphoglycerate mutase
LVAGEEPDPVHVPRRFAQAQFTLLPGATRILLVRHGESEEAIEGSSFELLEGQGNPDLSPLGRTQAEIVCRRLLALGVDAIYTSNLRRTTFTAEPLARATGLVPVPERDLREVFLGEWEGGIFRIKISDGDPVASRMLDQQRWDVIPGAEPQEEFRARVMGAIRRISESHPDQIVAVFSHGGTIGEILAVTTGSLPFAFIGSDNAAISEIVVSRDRTTLRRFNDTSHLSENR